MSKPRQVLCGGGVRGRACLSRTLAHRRLVSGEFTPDPDAKHLQGDPEGAQRQESGPCPPAAPVKKPHSLAFAARTGSLPAAYKPQWVGMQGRGGLITKDRGLAGWA